MQAPPFLAGRRLPHPMARQPRLPGVVLRRGPDKWAGFVFLDLGGTGTSWLDPLHDVGVELINGLKHGLDERPITLPAGFGADGQPPPGEGNVDLAEACREMARRYRTMDPRP
jgi:hypothetical protein